MAEPTTLPTISAESSRLIADLFMQGRRVSEVIAHGLGQRGGWRKQHVMAILTERGWPLDSDGRIPVRFRTTARLPAAPLPGQAPPEPPRLPAVEYPPEGTVTEGRGANAAATLIAQGKGHQAQWIRKLAEKAETALDALRLALKQDEQHAVVRNRLAELEAEAARLRAQLPRGVGRPRAAKPTTRAERGTSTVGLKPINHGSWGGYQAESKRGLDHCDACIRAKDEFMARMRSKSPVGGQASDG